MANLNPFRVGQSRGFAVVLLALLGGLFASPSDAHRSGCHRWHSCPSDTGSYICGDIGYCSQCPDNSHCLNGQPREAGILAPLPAARPAPTIPPPRVEPPARAQTPGETQRREAATVLRVVDGDTVDVEIAGRRERLRLIGLNTPETVDPRRPVECFGREASAKAKELLDGKRVELEADPTQGDRDKYGRLLRYMWLPDGRNFAEVMIAEGYGFEYTYRLPYRYQDRFQAAQREARAAGRGLWGPACGNGPVPGGPVPGGPVPGGPLPGGPVPGGPVPSDPSPDVSAPAAAPCQPGQIKANRRSGIYHLPSGAFYANTKANVVCFDSEGEAQAAGFRRAKP